jgi:hypothetical protein
MAAPTLTHSAQRLYDYLAPLAEEDERHGYALALYLSALARLVDEVADLSRDGEDGRPGWSDLFNPERIPARLLPWLAQFRGVQLPQGLAVEEQRQRIREADGFRRGSPAAMIAAAKRTLTGTQTVYLTERSGSAYALTVATLTSETPDPAATLAALREQKPAGIVLTHALITGGDYGTLLGTHADYAEVLTDFATYADVLANPAHT